MISYETLQSRFSQEFSTFEQVDEKVARCERSTNGRPFSVYYLDISDKVPTTVEELDDYQDRVIASRYFQGHKSLQWSHYLYFVVEQDVAAEYRALVERDRKYARKFVVSEQELDSALTPPKFQIAEGVVDASVFSTWTSILSEANLASAILNNESLPKRIERIEADYGHKGLATPTAAPLPKTSTPAFISSLTLQEFRPCPLAREFDFGTVTLVAGPNGSGKTSLLEAIELLYCGQNKRNPNVKEKYSIEATFRDGNSEIAKWTQSTSVFRDRNLAWYGQADVKKSTLYQSFARYNFLDTDAAVGLATSKEDVEENLSKLLVGAEASRTWREIGRTSKELDKKIKAQSGVLQQAELELNAVEKQLAEAAAVPKESDTLLDTLATALADASWPVARESLPSRLSELTAVLARHEAFVSEAVKCDWIDNPVTIEGLRKFENATGALLKQCADLGAAYHGKVTRGKTISAELASTSKRAKLAEELKRHLEFGLPARAKRVAAVREELGKVQVIAAHVDALARGTDSIPDITTSLRDFIEQARKRQERQATELAEATKQLAKFTQLRDRSVALSQQLRDVANRILVDSEKADTCPLCHAEYGPSELISRMSRDIDSQAEVQSTELRKLVRSCEVDFATAEKELALARWLQEFSSRTQMSEDCTVSEVRKRAAELVARRDINQAELHSLAAEMQSNLDAGLSMDRCRELVEQLFEPESAKIPTLDDVRKITAAIGKEIELSSREEQELRQQLDAELDKAATLLGIQTLEYEAFQDEVARKTKQRDTVLVILKSVRESEPDVAIPESQSLTELTVGISVVRKMLSAAHAAVTAEGKANVIASAATKRKEEVEKQLSGLRPRIERLIEAATVLQRILDKHSLSEAMDQALRQNKAAIEEIFRRIHSPAEFSGLESMTTLVRKHGGIATLQEVSSGQRAAFALSLFLAQNAQLRSAPQLILVDDPIAHIDDLNCLSFLDYLREVALSGERQIVFATANEKLASLFERKFDFLGDDDFKRHNLSR